MKTYNQEKTVPGSNDHISDAILYKASRKDGKSHQTYVLPTGYRNTPLHTQNRAGIPATNHERLVSNPLQVSPMARTALDEHNSLSQHPYRKAEITFGGDCEKVARILVTHKEKPCTDTPSEAQLVASLKLLM